MDFLISTATRKVTQTENIKSFGKEELRISKLIVY